MDPQSAGERRIPCGLCSQPVAEADFRGGLAKTIQGVLYCASCSREADRARNETAAFRQSAKPGAALACSRCRSAIPPEDVQAGTIVFYDGRLSCRNCARDLRTILGQRRSGEILLGAGKSAPPQPSGVGSVRLPPGSQGTNSGMGRVAVATPSSSMPRSQIATTPSGGMPRAQVAPANASGSVRLPPVSPTPSNRVSAPPGTGRFPAASAPATASNTGRFQAQSAPPAPSATGRFPQPAPSPGSVRTAAAPAPDVACALCQGPVPRAHVMEGKALVHEGSTYCVGCRPDAEALIGMNSGETKPLPSERAAPGAVIAAPPPPGQPLNPLLAAPPPQASPTGRVSQRLGKPPAVAELTPEQLMKSSAGDDEGAFPSTEQRPAAELRAGKAAPAATGPRCSRCKGPLEAGAAAGDVCPNCMLSSAADEESTRTALSLADVIGLKCAKCAKAIPQPDLARGDAGTVDGKLLCKQCRTKTAPRQASSKVNCQACDWAVSGKGYPYAGKTFCAACQPVFEQVLLEAVRPGPPAPCAQCKKPAVGDGILRVDGKVFCGACRKAAEFVVIYTVQSRRKPALKAAAQGSMGAPLAIAGGVVVFGLLVGLVAVKAIGKSTPIGPPVVDPLLKQAADPPYVVALTNARRLASVPAPSFQEAAKKLAEITALARDSGGTPEVQKAFKDLVDRATVERDVYARALVTIATNKANQAAKTSPEEALKALESVPKEVLDLPVAADLAKDRDRYQALIECRRRATALLSDPDPGNFAAMDTLAKSREAALCNFAVTEKGKELDIERRSRRTQVEAGAVRKTTLPPGNAADLVKKGGQQESKGDLAGAEATYEAALKLDPLGLSAGDALQGLARIDLEREHIDSARGRFRDLEHMAPDKPGTMVVQAWLQFLSAGHGDNRTLARASLKGLWKDGLGRLGRRLTAILDLGAPRREKTGYLLYAPTSFSEADLDVVERELEHTAKAVGVMLGVPPGDQRVPIVCFRDNASCAAFVSKLESTRDGYHIPGSFTVALVSPDAFSARAAVAQALGPRSIDPSSASSAWLAAALPLELASNDGVPGFGSMTLTQLEALSASAVLADPTALASARGIAAVIHEPGGVDVLKAYTEARRSHRSDLITKARRALDLLIKKARHD